MEENTGNKEQPTYFNGAAIIDKNNREIPITENMIREVLERLENVKPKSN